MTQQSLALFARTFLIGIAVAAPVGAMAALCLDRTLRRGWAAGMATGAGIATADGIYGAVAAFGVTAVSSTLVSAQFPLRVGGGLILIALGARAALLAGSHMECAPEGRVSNHAALYAGAVGLTLTNPMTIMAFAAVFLSAGIAEMPGKAEALIATAGVALGSLAWWLALVSICSMVRRGVNARAQAWLGRASGILVAAFGVYSLFSAFA